MDFKGDYLTQYKLDEVFKCSFEVIAKIESK
jgi:hypothetical protein